jgi:hypothetical protein
MKLMYEYDVPAIEQAILICTNKLFELSKIDQQYMEELLNYMTCAEPKIDARLAHAYAVLLFQDSLSRSGYAFGGLEYLSDQLEKECNELKAENNRLSALATQRHQEVTELKQERNALKAKYDELVSYLPKVPTEPYEKTLAKENAELRSKIKIALDVLDEAIKQIGD